MRIATLHCHWCNRIFGLDSVDSRWETFEIVEDNHIDRKEFTFRIYGLDDLFTRSNYRRYEI